MAHPVVHFEVWGSDPARLRSFYAEAFGWNLTSVEGYDYALVAPEGNGIGGGIGPGQTTGESKVTVYIGATDIHAALDNAVAHGAEVVMPVTDLDGMVTIALFCDPLGNVIGLVQTPEDEAP